MKACIVMYFVTSSSDCSILKHKENRSNCLNSTQNVLIIRGVHIPAYLAISIHKNRIHRRQQVQRKD